VGGGGTERGELRPPRGERDGAGRRYFSPATHRIRPGSGFTIDIVSPASMGLEIIR
jgi:hypothetical protein